MANDIQRTLSTLTYTAAGQVSTLDLPRDSVLKGLDLLIQMDSATTTTSATGPADAGTLAVIRRIEIVADGALTLWSIDPRDLWILDALWGHGWLQNDLLASTQSSTDLMQAALHIPFALPFSKNPNLTLLNAQALSSLQLRITWGAATDVWDTVNDFSITAATTTVTPQTHEVVGLSPRSVFSAFKVSQITREINATQTRLQVELPRGNIVRGLLFRGTETTGADIEQEGILNGIDIESSEANRGLFVHRRVRCTDTDGTGRVGGFLVRNHGRYLYGLNDFASLIATQHNNAASRLEGYYPIEFMEDKRTSSALRTQAFSAFNAILNVTTNTDKVVVITTQEIIPAARPRAA